MIPYDGTRQSFTNDLSRGDIETDKAHRDELLWEQERDRKQMAEAEVNTARDLIHAYGDARVKAWASNGDETYAAEAADAFAKLMLLVAELAKGAYE